MIDRPFTDRPTVLQGVRETDGWRVRRWFIRAPEHQADLNRFEAGAALALAALPSPAEAPGRAGLGFLIAHQGRGADYLVLGWWSRGNELPLRVWLRDGDRWRAARDEESVCVWDLDVIWRERQAYVRHILTSPEAPDLDGWSAPPGPA